MKNLVWQITTPQLVLRMLDIRDAVDLQELLEKNKEFMVPWVPWALDEPESVEMKKEKIRTWKGEFYTDQKYSYGIYEIGKEKLIGLNFLLTRQGKGILEIGYIIDHGHTGRGYATESSYALTKLGFQHIGIDQIQMHLNIENAASAKIPEKLTYKLKTTRKWVKKNMDGKRNVDQIWAMYCEDFGSIKKYEPVVFQLEEGWDKS